MRSTLSDMIERTCRQTAGSGRFGHNKRIACNSWPAGCKAQAQRLAAHSPRSALAQVKVARNANRSASPSEFFVPKSEFFG